MNLPSREECVRWDQSQVATFFCMNNMQECAATVHRLNINGQALLSLSDSEISKFSLIHQPQLQKIIQDIKKSDGSLLDKLRRLKSKPLPKLPARDYRDVDQLPDPDHHCCMYEEEQDDQYEPPPCQAMLPSANRASFSREDYLDNRCNFPLRPPRKPGCPSRNISKPQHPRASNLESDEDYIDPDESNNEDNYVEPAEDPAANFSAQGPNTERRLLSLPARLHAGSLTQPQPFPPAPSPRLNMRSSPTWVVAPTSDDEYEVCDPGGGGGKPEEARPGPPPKPLPRERSPRPAVKPKPDLKPREFESRALPEQHKAFSLDSKRPRIPPPQSTSAPGRRGASGPLDPEKAPHQTPNLDICNKPWYAGACDRKTADEVLIRSNKDGAFMVRKSSGQDAQQPYTLVVFYKGRVYNIPIRFVPATQQYALGREKSGEEYFGSVAHIIENHRRTPLVLIDGQNNTKDTTSLSHPVKPHGRNADDL